jgi:ATP-dependent helicase HrpA
VLATNVAETSLTVPGIRYVVDTGTARISRYSQRIKVQRLPIEPVSKASARQRAGRCGRLADGVCIRLYSEEDFEARPDFTDPEILRTNLASVILQMTTLGLGEVAAFPFVDPPDARNITDGVRLLEELRAFEQGEGDDTRRRLTAYGKTIALLPVDPRLARMAIEADRLGCLHDVLVVVAALSIQDPRERPLEQQEAAALSHKRFADEHSDFVAYLRLWDYLQEQQKALSGSAFRRMCKSEFLHYLRIREWQDLVGQLRAACKSAGFVVGGRDTQDAQDAAGTRDVDAIHRALLSGLLSQVGVRDEAKRDYLGARSARFGISPGSGLFKKQPQVVMAGELVETTRLWAHDVARIDPVWAEELGSHLVKRQYSEPRWSSRQGSAVATERVTLYGVPLVVGRTVGLAKVDPTLARELFIRHALVEGDWSTHHRFFHDNRELLRRLEELEARTRRRDIIVGDDVSARLLRPAAARRGRLGPALRHLVEARPPHQPRPAHLHRGPARPRRSRRHRGRRLPDDLAPRRPRPPAHLPVRAWRGRRRSDRPHRHRDPQPGRRRRIRLAGAGIARRARHRAHPHPAQDDPPPARPRPRARRRHRPRPARPRARAPPPAPSPRSWRGCCARPTASSSVPTTGTSPACPTTCA